MSDTIHPALTAEEWRDLLDGKGVEWDGFEEPQPAPLTVSQLCMFANDRYEWSDDSESPPVQFKAQADVVLSTEFSSEAMVSESNAPAVMAALNHILPAGHPLKITREDTQAARMLALDMTAVKGIIRVDPELMLAAERVLALAAKLAALLPPD